MLSSNYDDWRKFTRIWARSSQESEQSWKSWAWISLVYWLGMGPPQGCLASFSKWWCNRYCCLDGTWVLLNLMLTALEGFHQRVSLSPIWQATISQAGDRRMDIPLNIRKNKVLEEVGMYSIAHYIENWQNTVADYVATHLFLTFARNQSGDGFTLLQ